MKISQMTPGTGVGSDQVGANHGGATVSLTVAAILGGVPTTYTGNTALTAANRNSLVDATGGSFTMTLPAASSCAGDIFDLKRIDANAATVVTIAVTGGDTIDGAASYLLEYQGEFVRLRSTGSGWLVIGE